MVAGDRSSKVGAEAQRPEFVEAGMQDAEGGVVGAGDGHNNFVGCKDLALPEKSDAFDTIEVAIYRSHFQACFSHLCRDVPSATIFSWFDRVDARTFRLDVLWHLKGSSKTISFKPPGWQKNRQPKPAGGGYVQTISDGDNVSSADCWDWAGWSQLRRARPKVETANKTNPDNGRQHFRQVAWRPVRSTPIAGRSNQHELTPLPPSSRLHGQRENRPKTNQRNPHGGAVIDPFFIVAPRLEDARGVDDAFQHLAVGAAAMELVATRPAAPQLAGGDLGAGLFEPVGDEVGAAGHAAVVGLAQGFDVVGASSLRMTFVAQKSRVADDDIGGRPVGFAAVRVEQGVAVFDAVERFEDGVDGVRVAVLAAPLDVADPDGDAGEFGGESVDFGGRGCCAGPVCMLSSGCRPSSRASMWARFRCRAGL